MRKSKYTNSKTNFHILRENDKLNMQNDFIFFDTETKRIKTKKITEEKFYLGWLKYWNKEKNTSEYYFLKEKKDFFNYVLNLMKNKNHLIIFAHNMDFDLKVIGGIGEFIKKGYEVESFYINGCRFIVKIKKGLKVIEFLDTMNYIPSSLKYIGESIGLKKMDIDFNTCNDKELSIYCKNDVEIIYLFIFKLIKFLEKYNLSKLKPTVSSLSMNIFRHRFYNKKKNPIYIHGWKKAVELERLSYCGGISDCFKVGTFKEHIYKLDINSMYPYVMKNKEYPIKLLCYRDEIDSKTNYMMKLYKKYKKEKLIIARCDIYIPKEYAYILIKTSLNKEDKSMFLYGNLTVSLTTPELNFIEKYGKIIKIRNIAIYDKSIIFSDFVDFFYNQRLKFSEENNQAYKLFCKYILNSLYGKFGQTSSEYYESDNKNIEFSSNYVIDTINNDDYIQMSLGNKSFEVINEGKNSFDSFVAIASFVTAYARMYLINMIFKAKRKNVYYVDTDCLMVNKEGYENLKYLIDSKELGKLKLEEESDNTIIYKPKFYEFNNISKCKVVKKSAKIISEDNDKIIFQQENFTKFKSSLRKNENDKQTVSNMIKEINKHYDKGKILENGDVEPYEYK